MIRKMIAYLGLLALTLAIPGPALAQHRQAARIVELQGPSTEYLVRRGNADLAVWFNMPLQVGDRVYARNARHAAVLRYTDSSWQQVTVTNTPYTVQLRGANAGISTNLWDAFWQRVTRVHDAIFTTHIMRAPDAPPLPLALDMPGLRDGSARIASGNRHFMLSWTGGDGPYRVTVRDAKGGVLLDESGLSSSRLVKASRWLSFPPGVYSIEVSTSTERVNGSFAAVRSQVPRDTLPAFNRDFDAEIAAAAQIAQSGRRELMFEAYLRLTDSLAHQYGLAVALSDYFAAGARDI